MAVLTQSSRKAARSATQASPSRSPAPRAKAARKSSVAGDATKTKLLDAAEHMFADHGYDGTALRDIAKTAGVHMALSTYHFGTKEALFDEIIRRRAVEMERLRLANLDGIDFDTLTPTEAVRQMILAYVKPMIDARYSASKPWQAHVRLLAGLVNVKRWAPVISKHYDHCAQAYIERWKTVLPHVETNSLLNSFSFMVVAMLYVCSNTGRFGRWKDKATSRKEELDAVTDDLVSFVHAGFMSLTSRR